MAFYRPCHNCILAKQPCARRSRVAEGIKGLGLTSASFRCAERTPITVHGLCLNCRRFNLGSTRIAIVMLAGLAAIVIVAEVCRG